MQFRKSDRVRRQAMPVAGSILWKPLRDSHYVLASLQRDRGGRRELFVTQPALATIQGLFRSARRDVLGILLGHRLDCPLSGTKYVIIDGLAEVPCSWDDASSVRDALTQACARVSGRGAPEPVGWYSASWTSDGRMSESQASIHFASFSQPWQTALVVGSSGDSGAFFLYDALEARWFRAPFYELVESKGGRLAPKPTCVSWPEYLTTESVRVLSPAAGPTGAALTPTRRKSAWNRARDASSRMVATVVAPRAAKMRLTALSAVKAVAKRASNTVRLSADRISRIRAERAARAEERRAAERELARQRSEQRAAELAARREAARVAREQAAARAAAKREAERVRAEQEAARRLAEREAAQLRAKQEAERKAAEREAARLRAEQEAAARALAEEEAARARAEQEAAARALAEQRRAKQEAERRVAEQEAARVRAEQEAAAQAAARLLAEQRAARELAEREAADRLVQERAARKAAEQEAARVQAEQRAARELEEREAERLRAEQEAELRATAEREVARLRADLDAATRAAADRAARLRTEQPEPSVLADLRRATENAVADLDDTTPFDSPYRYLALARREGFVVSETREDASGEIAETFWRLNEPVSGLVLTVITSDDGVREAQLHYNLHVDDEAVLRATSPEHRDLSSSTIYVREDCIEHLRARCRRLRATKSLEPEWKVTPPSGLRAISQVSSDSGPAYTGPRA